MDKVVVYKDVQGYFHEHDTVAFVALTALVEAGHVVIEEGWKTSEKAEAREDI